MKTQFSPRQAISKILLALHAEFGLIWTTPWPDEKDLFLKFFSRNSKVPYEIITFSLGKSYQNYFLLYTFIAMVIRHTEFGLNWTTAWPDEKEIFLKFAKIRISGNS